MGGRREGDKGKNGINQWKKRGEGNLLMQRSGRKGGAGRNEKGRWLMIGMNIWHGKAT